MPTTHRCFRACAHPEGGQAGASRFLRPAVGTAFLLTLSAAAAGAQGAPAPSPRAQLASADAALSSESRKHGLAAALVPVLGEHVVMLVEGAPVVTGRANAEALVRAQPAMNRLRVQWSPQVVEVSNDGLFGATWGVTSIEDSSASSPARFSKYIAAWERANGGSWRLAAYVQTGLSAAEELVMPASVVASTTRGVDPSSSAAPFARADIAFATLARDQGAPKAFGAFAAPDAVTFGGGGIVVGPANIQARMAAGPLALAQWAWTPLLAGGSAAGDLGFTVGESTIRAKDPDGAPAVSYGKYLTIWRKQPDGSIKFLTDGGTSRPAPR